MLPLHAATCITLSMCSFCIGFGIGWLKRPRQTITNVIRIPADATPGNVVEVPPSDRTVIEPEKEP